MNAPIRGTSGEVNVYFRWSGPTETKIQNEVRELISIKICNLPTLVIISDLPKLNQVQSQTMRLKIMAVPRGSIQSDNLKISAGQLDKISLMGCTRVFSSMEPRGRDSEEIILLRKPPKIEVGKSYTIDCSLNYAAIREGSPVMGSFKPVFTNLERIIREGGTCFQWIASQKALLADQLLSEFPRNEIEEMLCEIKAYIFSQNEIGIVSAATKLLEDTLKKV